MGATEDSTQPTERVVLHDNVFVEQRAGLGRARVFPKHSSTGVMNDTVLKNNIIESDDPTFGQAWHGSTNAGNKGDSILQTDNILVTQKSSGPWAADSNPASVDALNILWTSYTFAYNALWGSAWTTSTIANNTVVTSGTWASCFTDLPGGDYSVAAGHGFKNVGTAGADPGPDTATLATKQLYTLYGQRPSEI